MPALPETEPAIVCANMFAPENVLLLARRVEEAEVIVIEPPALKFVPLMVPRFPFRYEVVRVEVPTTLPCESVERRAFPSPVNTRFVVVAVPLMVRPPVAVPLPIVVEA